MIDTRRRVKRIEESKSPGYIFYLYYDLVLRIQASLLIYVVTNIWCVVSLRIIHDIL